VLRDDWREHGSVSQTQGRHDPLGEKHDAEVLYFHAHWRRERRGDLDKDFVILPKVRGAGRYIGANVSVLSDPAWGKEWWGEGEVKVYLDGDDKWPTLVGTGTEDYVSSAWGMGRFAGERPGGDRHSGRSAGRRAVKGADHRRGAVREVQITTGRD
jgi:hypothetical protein